MSEARSHKVTKPQQICRGFDNRKAFMFGRYWVPCPDETPHYLFRNKTDYRTAFGICPAGNDLTHAVVCTLRVGATVVMGPGQSANCNNERTPFTIPASSKLQFFVADPEHDIVDCKVLY